MSTWIDITRPIDDTLVLWPGHPRPQQRWEKRLAAGDHCNSSSWQLSAHSGTHLDAPLHFVANGKSIDQISSEVFLGDCQVREAGLAPLDEAAVRSLAGTKRLLVKTTHSQPSTGGHYQPHAALLTESAAKLLLDSGLVLLGTDRLSVDDSNGQSFRLHHLLLEAGCVIIEGLLLASVKPGAYSLVAAPLRLTGGEASPVRALLRPLTS